MWFLAAFDTIPYIERRLLVDPEVQWDRPRLSSPRYRLTTTDRSVPRVGLWDGELQPFAAHSEAMEVTRSRRIHVWSLAVDDNLKVDLQRLS